ncbi:hypothetical protein LINPERHAP1_LOCUS913 [Linum perenne]
MSWELLESSIYLINCWDLM